MKMISEYKKELIVGLIFICLQPIFNYIGNQLVKLFISINTLYSENYYKSIAINNENEFSQSNSFFLSYILIFILLALIILFHEKNAKLKQNLDNLSTKIEKNKNKLQNKSNQILTADDLIAILESNGEKVLNIKATTKKIDKLWYFMVSLCVFFAIIIFTSYAKDSSVSKQNLTFKNDLIIISPYLESKEIILLKSEWAQIKNAKDFSKIKSKINKIKKINNLE